MTAGRGTTESKCPTCGEVYAGPGRSPSPEVRDLGALLGHVEAALAVVDRMNARCAGTVTDETRRFLAHVTAEVDARLDDVTAPARGLSSTQPADALHSPRPDGPECNTGIADA